MCGGNEIALRHNEFEGAIGECNDGAIVGYSLNNTDGFFTSQLDVTLSTSLQGETIACSIDDGTLVTRISTAILVVSTQASKYNSINIAQSIRDINVNLLLDKCSRLWKPRRAIFPDSAHFRMWHNHAEYGKRGPPHPAFRKLYF